MTKRQIRQMIQSKRQTLSEEYKESANQSILRQILELKEFQEADTIFCYVSTEDEVNTWPILGFALKQGKRVGVPICIKKGLMEVREIQSFEDLEHGYYGIMEPKKDCKVLSKNEVQLGIIPCVSADIHGNRLGHGAGFYDRYLEDTKFLKVLLCWKNLMCESIPMDSYDIQMDTVIFDK